MTPTENKWTAMMLVRLDSVARIENTIATIKHLQKTTDATVYVREADDHCNGILQQLVGGEVWYEFVEDDDPILHKTWHFNRMLEQTKDTWVGIWDADVIADASAVSECLNKLQSKEAEFALPYNGVCLDTSEIIRALYLKTRDETVLSRHINKMNRMSAHILTGGAVMMNRQAFLDIGGENETYYGWGDDDFDRYIRFMNRGMQIYRSRQVLFHLSHPRSENSGFQNSLHQWTSKRELHRTRNLLP